MRSYKLTFNDGGTKWVIGKNAKEAVAAHFKFHPKSPPVYTVQHPNGKMVADRIWHEANKK
jgi:hypothetical protein